jgi:predicted nucleic acid-binding protein
MSGNASSYLLDTNILIYYFNGVSTVQGVIDQISERAVVGYYCPRTWIKLLCYPSLSESEAQIMREFLRSLIRVDLSEAILDCSAGLRRDYGIPLADSVIAACCLAVNSCLVSRNTKDFNRIPGLALLNPFQSG